MDVLTRALALSGVLADSKDAPAYAIQQYTGGLDRK